MARRPTEDDIRHVYRETIDDLYAFVSRRCDGDRALAEDVTQETWLRAVKAWRADGLGLTERGVEGRLRRARQTLRHEIQRDRDAEGGTS